MPTLTLEFDTIEELTAFTQRLGVSSSDAVNAVGVPGNVGGMADRPQAATDSPAPAESPVTRAMVIELATELTQGGLGDAVKKTIERSGSARLSEVPDGRLGVLFEALQLLKG